MTKANPETRPIRNEKTVWREVEEEIYVCSADGETMYTISDVGADIWRVCDGEHSLAEIVELLLAAYEVDRQTLENDLSEYLQDMESKGLIIMDCGFPEID